MTPTPSPPPSAPPARSPPPASRRSSSTPRTATSASGSPGNWPTPWAPTTPPSPNCAPTPSPGPSRRSWPSTRRRRLRVMAIDAKSAARVAIGLLRQHIHAGDRVHGIVTHGGEAPNIVPAHTEAEYIVRGATVADFEIMRERVMRCFEAGALATGTTLDVMARHEPYA